METQLRIQKSASDILIEYFIAKNNYKSLMEFGFQSQQAYSMDADLTVLKADIMDQIAIGPFEQVFGRIDKGTPVGFTNGMCVMIHFLDFDTDTAFTKNVPRSDYYQYLSLCHKQIEDTHKKSLDI